VGGSVKVKFAAQLASFAAATSVQSTIIHRVCYAETPRGGAVREVEAPVTAWSISRRRE
jgi:hypothetical protein